MLTRTMDRGAARAGLGWLLILVASCAGMPPPEDTPGGEPGSTLVGGETAATTIERDGAFYTTVIEHGAVAFKMVTQAEAVTHGYRFEAELFADGQSVRRESFAVAGEEAAAGTTLEGLNRLALFKLGRMRDVIAAEKGLPLQQDKAGCDGIGGSCGPFGSCCDMHDKCLADCWEGLAGGTCALGCDGAVAACFTGATIPCAIAQIFGAGEGCKSECCDVGGRNICEADCSDATPGGWYKWGNHSCTPDVLINFYCVADAGSCSNYHCYKYDGHTGASVEITDGSYACDACAEGYCNDAYNCVTCPDPIVDPQGHPLGGRDPYCNPPVYTPGSFMDSICNNGQKPLPPPHSTRLTCDAVRDENGCHNVCSFESGLGGGAQNFCGPMPGTDACIAAQPGHAIPRGCDGAGHCVVETWCDFNDAKNWRAHDFRWTACQIGPPDNLKPYCDGSALPSWPPEPAGPSCGDGACNSGEDCGNCAGDCPCPGGTTCENSQCVVPPQGPICGDGSCDGGESCGGCPQDCGACETCGNGVCDGYPEDCGTCAGDCPCPGGTTCQDRQCVAPPQGPTCGDGACEPGVEDCGNCAGDCPCPGGTTCENSQCVAPPQGPTCGDGACEPGVEDCGTCAGDCPCPGGTTCQDRQCVTYCGNGTCDAGEDCNNCPGECGACSVCYDTCQNWVEDTCWNWIDVCDEFGCGGYWEPYGCNGRWEPYECNPHSC